MESARAACAVMGGEVEARDMGLSMVKMESAHPDGMKELPVRWIEASTPGIGGVRAGDAKRTGSVYAEGSAAQP